MKLILGSDLSFLLKYGYDLTGIPKDQIRIGYVTTASKGARKFSQRVKEIIMPAIKEKLGANSFVDGFRNYNFNIFVEKDSGEVLKNEDKLGNEKGPSS